MKFLSRMNERLHFHFCKFHYLVFLNVIAVRGKLLPYQMAACEDLKSSLYILLKNELLL